MKKLKHKKNQFQKLKHKKFELKKLKYEKFEFKNWNTKNSNSKSWNTKIWIPKIETRKFRVPNIKTRKIRIQKSWNSETPKFPIQFTTSVCQPLFYRNRKDHRTHLAKVNRTSPWLMINFWSNSSVIRSFLNQTTFVRRLSCNLQDSIVLPTMTKTVS